MLRLLHVWRLLGGVGAAMLFKHILRDLGRWVLLAFGLFVIVVLLMLAIQMGALGPVAQDVLNEFWKSLDDFYKQHKAVIDKAAWTIGIAGSFVTAVLTIHRSWYYAELNFPRRLKEWMERAISGHLEVRPELLATVNDPVAPTSFLTPIVHYGYFDWVMGRTGLGHARARARVLAASLHDLKDDLGVVEVRRKQLETQTVTAYLLRGAGLSGEAALEVAHSDPWREKNDAALKEFLQALDVKHDDVDALELAAKQYLILGEHPHALDCLEKMASAAKNEPLRRARALRSQAEILEKESTDASLNAARSLLIATIDEVLLPHKRSSPERTLELAKAYRVRGEVQLKREKFTASDDALLEAKARFERLLRGARNARDGELRLFGQVAAEGLASTADALRRLAQAKKDNEAPGE
jgi:tetratricopeptide (TPR) repeat protein